LLSIMAAESPATPVARPVQRLRLRPKVGWQPIDLGELWRYRELLWTLAMRDIRVRYKQTVLGATWAVIQPFMLMIGFTLLAKFNGDPNASLIREGVPYPIFLFTGLIIWQLFSSAMSTASNSLVGNSNLITKVYFPRLVMPIAAVITGLIDFVISAAILVILMLIYHVHTVPQLLFAPLFVVLAFFAALSVGLWLSALNVEYRDVRYVVPFIVQFGVLVSPVAFPTDNVHKAWERVLFGLNPMSGVVEGFRWCVYGQPTPGWMLIVSMFSTVVVLIGGLFYFRRMEKTFADVV
jgi:lipopolysaccharide transport system permease protein